MKIGVVGLMPRTAAEVTPATAARLRENGFSAARWDQAEPLADKHDELRHVRTVLEDGGVRIAQSATRNRDLVSADEGQRQQGIREMQAACRGARVLNSVNLYVRPGSLNPAGSWTPHPENTRVSTIERLVDSLREISKAAEDEGVLLALEGAAVSPLPTSEAMRDVIEAVGSPALRFNTDPVNFVGCVEDMWNTSSLVNRMFDVCGPYVLCGHAKDIRYENTVTVRFHECIIGEGLMDQVTYLRRFQECCPDGYMLIEHLADKDVPQAKRALDAALAEAGLEWDE